jgi:hypothetical protein
MSRAFVNEDAGSSGPRRDFHLPARDDPGYDAAAARALLEAARVGETLAAEEATGYRWGDPQLASYVEELMRNAETAGDDRLAQLAMRFLR